MKFKLDENLGNRRADLLRAAGHDVLTVPDQGLARCPDGELFEYCKAEGRVLVTLDLDFSNPLRFDPSGSPGIVVLRTPDLPSSRDLTNVFETLIAGVARADIADHLWVVRPGRIRQYEPRSPEGS